MWQKRASKLILKHQVRQPQSKYTLERDGVLKAAISPAGGEELGNHAIALENRGGHHSRSCSRL
jgi:hypothetical protein